MNKQKGYVNEYLVNAFRELGRSQSEVIKDLGKSQPYVSALMSGKKKVGKEISALLNKLYGFDELAVMKGEENISKSENNYIQEVKPVPYENYMVVEYAKLSTVAGKLGFENPATLPETRTKLVPREFDKGNYLVVEVDGDSMDDGTSISIPDGTDILIKEYRLNVGEKLPIRGNLFVIVTKEGTVFKQIVEHNIEGGYIVCHSYNPKYKDYKVQLEDILQIFIYRKIVSFRPSIPEI